MAGLIQNYTNTINQNLSALNKTTKAYYNNLKDADSDNLLRPLDGKGYLVDESPLNAPKEFVRDTYYTTKALQKGLTGKANDNELGKMNDLGLKLGGLGIATYLMTKRPTLKAKAMEFIGFGSFLASMAIWPKLAIELPTRLRFGFNPRKQYYDEQGRKKYVTQDPNYIPFDLFKGKKANEDLGKIGDRMGISRDIKNRDEVTKEQIRKISVQDNTLWMLSAGVATPVMTALACNQLEGPVGKFFENRNNKKANKLAEEIQKYNRSGDVESLVGDKIARQDKKLEELLTSKLNQTLSKDDVTSISKLMMDGFDNQTSEAATKDLKVILSADKTVVTPELSNGIVDKFSKSIEERFGKGFAESIVSKDGLTEHVEGFMKKNGGNGVLDAEASDELRRHIGDYFSELTKGIKPEGKRKTLNSAFGSVVNDVFELNKVAVLTPENKDTILKVNKALNRFQAVNKKIEKVANFKVEKAPETIVGNHWGEVTDTLVKGLKITPEEMKFAIATQENSAELLASKLEKLVQNPEDYKNFVRTLAHKIQELDVRVDNPQSGKANVMDTVLEAICKNSESVGGELNGINGNPFENLARRFNGTEVDGVRIGSLREAQVNRIKQARIGGVQSAYMRLLKTADFFKQAHDANGGSTEREKRIFEQGKKILVSAHPGEFYGKFQTNNLPQYYHKMMYKVFRDNTLSSDTKAVLDSVKGHEIFNGSEKISMSDRVTKWSKRVGDLMLEEFHDFLPNHGKEGYAMNEKPFRSVEKTAVEKFNKIGCTPANMLYDALKNKHNSGLWLKFWGTVGAVTLGATLLAQLGFGKKDSSIQSTGRV